MAHRPAIEPITLANMYSSSLSTSPSPRPPSGLWAVVVVLVNAMILLSWWSPGVAASDATQTSAASSEYWVPPIVGAGEADIVHSFIPPQMPWSAAHRGLDLRSATQQIMAPAAGEVTFVGTVVDRPVITIRHANGLLSSFEPVESDLQAGDTVSQGQQLGELSKGVSHCEVQCVHWGVRKPDAWRIGSTRRDLYIDPAFILGWTEPSILWPIHTDPAS